MIVFSVLNSVSKINHLSLYESPGNLPLASHVQTQNRASISTGSVAFPGSSACACIWPSHCCEPWSIPYSTTSTLFLKRQSSLWNDFALPSRTEYKRQNEQFLGPELYIQNIFLYFYGILDALCYAISLGSNLRQTHHITGSTSVQCWCLCIYLIFAAEESLFILDPTTTSTFFSKT
jgi:hypothetical protein